MLNTKDFKITALFIVIAFSLPLLCILLINFSSIEHNSILFFILFGIEAASPSIAAITAIGVCHGRKGILEFISSSFDPKLKLNVVLTPIIIALSVMFTAKAVACLLMGTVFQINHLSITDFIIIAWAFLAEEAGWRGFLHKKLAKVVPEFALPLILGLVWSAWHYHFFILGTTDAPILWFIIGAIAESYIYSFLLRLTKGNLLVAMLYHMSNNLFINTFGINTNVNEGSPIPYMISVIITILLGIAFNIYINKGLRRIK